jgi:hypothetical protein
VAVFIFDCSSAHEAYASDALLAHKMNRSPGGSQLKMHHTINPATGQVQHMVYPTDSTEVDSDVSEREAGDLTRRKTCCMHRVLSLQPDFVTEKPLLQVIIEKAGHKCLFLPKFHCELNSIEMVWGQAKRCECYSRSNFVLSDFGR